ncbi:MAG: hypothetical protein ACTSUF_04670 [Candidatus Heimdallarchaeaceae archaeon]
MVLDDKKSQLPATFRGQIRSKWRITIPTYITFIEPRDYVSGYITIPHSDVKIPFQNKLVNASRMVSIGSLLRHLPRGMDPKSITYVDMTIERVKKSIQSEVESYFNVCLYQIKEQTPLLNFTLQAVSDDIQFHLDDFAVKYTQKILGSTFKRYEFVEPFLIENLQLWITPIFFSIRELSMKYAYIMILILDLENYQNYLKVKKQMERLIRRFVSWANDTTSVNVETLAKLSTDMQRLIYQNQEPEYYDIGKIINLPEFQRDIIINLIRSHRSRRFLSINELAQIIGQPNWIIEDHIAELLDKGLIYEVQENKKTKHFDVCWYT